MSFEKEEVHEVQCEEDRQFEREEVHEVQCEEDWQFEREEVHEVQCEEEGEAKGSLKCGAVGEEQRFLTVLILCDAL